MRPRRAMPALVIALLAASSIALAAPDREHAEAKENRQQIAFTQRFDQSLSATLTLDDKQVSLTAQPVSLRSAEFQLFTPSGIGHRRLEAAPPPRTYRGTLSGELEGRVALSEVNGRLHGIIVGEDDEYWQIEPVPSGIAAGETYEVTPVDELPPVIASCGSDDHGEAANGSIVPPRHYAVAGGSPLMIADVAFDADYEYYQSNGSSVTATLADVEAIMNSVAMIYEAQSGITYELTAVIVRTTLSDPYTAPDHENLLDQFQCEWNVNQRDIHRDVAHLMTGRDVLGGFIGSARRDTMCDICGTAESYGFSETTYSALMFRRVCLTAHELGHNWGATHCNGDADCGIMCATIDGCPGSCTQFGTAALSTIIAGRVGANCLASEATAIAFPFCDTFEGPIDLTAWSFVAGAATAGSAVDPPSGGQALELNNCCAQCALAPDEIRSNHILLGGVESATVTYHTQAAGGPSATGSQLVVEYGDGLFWTELNRLTDTGSTPIGFDFWSHQLPPEALTDEFRLRFRLENVTGFDHWFVDDVAVSPAGAIGSVLHVNAAASSGGGTAWDDAINDLQTALTVAACSGGLVEEIRVAEGTYKPDRGTGDRGAAFRMINGVQVLGGYSSTDSSAARNPAQFATILSGDIGTPGVTTDNAFHVVNGTGTNTSAVLDGVTVTGGRADGFAGDGGGGIVLAPGATTVRYCDFVGNHGITGGAVQASLGANPTFESCRFINNTCSQSGGAGLVSQGSTVNFLRSSFFGNQAASLGGALYMNNSATLMESCIVSGNIAANGGGLYNHFGSLTFRNGTVVANSALSTIGGLQNTNGSSVVTSSIFWDNTDAFLSGSQEQLFGNPEPVPNYSIVKGYGESPPGTGNSGDDPLFVDANGADNVAGTPDDDFTLSAGSPALDTGDPGVMNLPGRTDAAGHPRVLCGRVDMGALEKGLGDFDCNDLVELADIAGWAACLSGPLANYPTIDCAALDFNVDGRVDLTDYGAFQSFLETH